MVGVIGDDSGRPVKLLGQHGPGQQMRPSRAAHCPQMVGFGALGSAMTIGRAQHKTRLLHAGVAPFAEQARQFLR